MPGRHYVLAFSGGLDTSYALAVLVDRGERVTTVTVNTGGFPPDELREIEQRSQELGADEHVVIDGRARLYDQFVSYILKANYLRNGVYPSCVGVERMLQAEEVTRVALERGADVIAHGSTGAGNDHVRFDAVTKALAPKLEIAGLIRDEQHTREEERDFLRERGHAVSDITAKYSFNFGILGTTIGGEETYGSWEYLPEEAWPTTRSIADAPDEPAELLLRFERGLPVACETVSGVADADAAIGELGIGVPGYDTLALLNRIGAAHGVGPRHPHRPDDHGHRRPARLRGARDADPHRRPPRARAPRPHQRPAEREGVAGHDVRRHAPRGPLLRPAAHRHPRLPGQLPGARHRRGAGAPAQGQHRAAGDAQSVQPA